jgi:hypothetical protein
MPGFRKTLVKNSRAACWGCSGIESTINTTACSNCSVAIAASIFFCIRSNADIGLIDKEMYGKFGTKNG